MFFEHIEPSFGDFNIFLSYASCTIWLKIAFWRCYQNGSWYGML